MKKNKRGFSLTHLTTQFFQSSQKLATTPSVLQNVKP